MKITGELTVEQGKFYVAFKSRKPLVIYLNGEEIIDFRIPPKYYVPAEKALVGRVYKVQYGDITFKAILDKKLALTKMNMEGTDLIAELHETIKAHLKTIDSTNKEDVQKYYNALRRLYLKTLYLTITREIPREVHSPRELKKLMDYAEYFAIKHGVPMEDILESMLFIKVKDRKAERVLAFIEKLKEKA